MIVDLYAVVRNKRSHIPFIQFSLYNQFSQYNQIININTKYWLQISPVLHALICVFSSMQFNQIHVTTSTTSQDTEQF